jgi:hypothetical protein
MSTVCPIKDLENVYIKGGKIRNQLRLGLSCQFLADPKLRKQKGGGCGIKIPTS